MSSGSSNTLRADGTKSKQQRKLPQEHQTKSEDHHNGGVPPPSTLKRNNSLLRSPTLRSTSDKPNGMNHMSNANAASPNEHVSTDMSDNVSAQQRRTSRASAAANLSDDQNADSSQMMTTSSGSIQMVPIQKFSFFKWQINVDTLVRLFIVA